MVKKALVIVVVVAALGGLLFAKARSETPATPGMPASAVREAGPRPDGSITSVHNDAVADYAAAVKTGKPVYVLFHSLS